MKFIDYLQYLLLDSIEYVKPSFHIEIDELKRTSQELGLVLNDLINGFNDSKIDVLSNKDWNKLENTDSNKINNIKDVQELAIKYDKDFDRVYNQIIKDKKIEVPIILYRKGYNPYLIGGNTRLSILRVLKIEGKINNPQVLKIIL
jgi:hypothetical protein